MLITLKVIEIEIVNIIKNIILSLVIDGVKERK
jgi:hypothetical protein